MAEAMLTAKLLDKTKNIRTPKGRLVYPNLFEPTLMKGETDQSKAKHGVTLLIPAGADITVLRKAVSELIEENIPAKARATTKVRSPFLNTADQPRFAELAEEYPVMIRCGSKGRPNVVGPTNKPVTAENEDTEVYSGREGRLTVRPFFYDHKVGGKGVSFGLQNVQLLDHNDPIAGARARAEDEFEAVGDELDDLAA